MAQGEEEPGAERARGKGSAARWGWWAFWMLFAIALYTPLIDVAPGQGNVQSDLAAIESLVNRQTFFINESPFVDTLDKFRREDGRFFSQKSPIFHLVAALPAKGLKWAGFDFVADRELFQRVITFVMVIVPMGWLLGLVFDHPWLRRRSVRERFVLTLLLGVGSLLTPFAVTLNHYTLAAATLLCAVRLLSLESAGEPAPGARRIGLGVGFWVAASLACDVPCAFLFGAGVGCLWLVRPGRARLAWMAAGAAPLLILYAALNVQIVGSPLPPNLHESTMLYYEGSYWSALKAQAEAGNPGYYQASYGRRIYHATLGHKGILWMWPLLGMALFAAGSLARRRAAGWELVAAWGVFPFVVIAVTMWWACDLSGGAYGIRHVFPALTPLYCVLGHPALRMGRGARVTFWGLGVWGVAIAGIGVINPWSHNVLSAYPPLENLARFAIAHPRQLDDRWVEGVIDATSVAPANGWLDLGQARTEHRDLPGAERALRRAIQSDPRETLAYYHLGVLLDMRGRSEEAIAVYLAMLEVEPDNVSGWNNLGLFAMHARRRELAEMALARSEVLAPENAGAMLGRLLMIAADGKAATDHPVLKRALELHGEDERIRAVAEYWREREGAREEGEGEQ